jgi:quaternary ammonium compound-resistance protein SugE
VSNVTSDQLRAAQAITTIESVENLYNARERASTSVLELCERDGVPFLTFHPLGLGALTDDASPLAAIATELHASPAQVALAWLLGHSPVILPIPGTTSVAHLEETSPPPGYNCPPTRLSGLARRPPDEVSHHTFAIRKIPQEHFHGLAAATPRRPRRNRLLACIKSTNGFTRPLPTLVCIALAVIAVYPLTLAMRDLPVGTAYAVFTGLGAVGATTLGILIYRDPPTLGRLSAIGLITAGLITARLVSPG